MTRERTSSPSLRAAGSSSASASNLLTIDVEAEIRKLCGDQVGPGDVPIELVRLAVRVGAHSVRVDLGSRFTTLVAAGAHLDLATLEALAMLADPHAGPDQRHAALLHCEATYGRGLLSLVAATEATVISADASGRYSLTLRSGERPSFCRAPASGAHLTMRIKRSGARAPERAALGRACRHASLPVLVDGKRVSYGPRLEGCFLEGRLEAGPYEIFVGLPAKGELCHTIVLRHEVVCKENLGLSPRGFTHVALVRDRTPGDDPIAMRRIKDLVRSARQELYTRLRRTFASLSMANQNAGRELLLRRAEHGGGPNELYGVPLFRRLLGSPIDLTELQRIAHQRVVWAIEPSATGHRWLGERTEIFVLSAREREYLTRQLGLVAQQPASSPADSAFPRLWLQARNLARIAARVAQRGWSRLAGHRVAPPSALTPTESLFVTAILNEIAAGRFTLPEIAPRLSQRAVVHLSERGSLPLVVRRIGAELCVLVPRSHPRVQRMMTALARDPSLLYPTMLALFGGHDGYGPRKGEMRSLLVASPGHAK